MTIITIKTIALAAAVAVSASSAYADDLYFGGSVGKSSQSSEYYWETTTNTGAYAGSDSLSGGGNTVTGYVGTRGIETGERTSLGVELSFSQFDFGATGPAQLGYNDGSIGLDSALDLQAMLFYDISEKTTLFFGAGVTSGSFTLTSDHTAGFNGIREIHSFSSDGWVVSAGFERKLTENLSFRIGAKHREYGHGESFDGYNFGSSVYSSGGSSSTEVFIGLTWVF